MREEDEAISRIVGGRVPLRKNWCGRRDLNPHGPFKPCGFSYRLRLSPPGGETFGGSRQVCGLDYPFTLFRKLRSLGAARLVSTPSRRCFSGLGSGLPFKVSPNLSSSASPVSRRALKYSLSPLRMPFRHARARLPDCISIIGQIRGDLHARHTTRYGKLSKEPRLWSRDQA